MKIAILAAGTSKYFPLFIDKPKCLYHLNGMIQLERVIEDAKTIVDEKDIIIVAGYKAKYIERFLEKYPDVKLKINEKYAEAAIHSFRKAIEGEDDDFIFMFGDESISRTNLRRIAESKRKIAVLNTDKYWYYSLGIMKMRRDQINIINDEKYLSLEYIKDIFEFVNRKKYDYTFDINSGICIGYTMIDFILRVGNIKKIEDPQKFYIGTDIDFLFYDVNAEYIPDLDTIEDTDEYKNSFMLRVYTKCISEVLKLPRRIYQREKRKWMRLFQ
ncbi:NTP transferase domain-containing protein [Pseudobutyrivibrio sp. LB2011]|uniref:NTP transferase domain-containing protein n=1 Tax=Pseudobutyrivibrio sp. LB2011 TaxID=1408312 RepID=UPI0005D2CB0D|nr:NTP transferase domain-containing protein [Pseudobutyrivibrio sp. LB2011]